MEIVLPTFEGTFCQMVGVCFCQIAEEVPASVLPLDEIRIVSSYEAHPGPAFARLIWSPATKHFHVDVALRTAFGKKVPVADTTIEEFRETIGAFAGLTASAFPHGTFTVPVNSLPATGGLIFVGNSAIKVDIGRAEIAVTGATLEFRRSDLRKIRWDLTKDAVRLDVDAKRRVMSVDGEYITYALRLLDIAVATYILRRTTDDNSDA